MYLSHHGTTLNSIAVNKTPVIFCIEICLPAFNHIGKSIFGSVTLPEYVAGQGPPPLLVGLNCCEKDNEPIFKYGWADHVHVQELPKHDDCDCKVVVYMGRDCDVKDSIFNTLFAGTVYVVPGVRLIT
jgi:hypothetical protein